MTPFSVEQDAAPAPKVDPSNAFEVALEKFGLTNQLRRASVSLPSYIAEGSSRNSNKDFARFLQIAIGSAYEIETQLMISCDLNLISKKELQGITSELEEIIKMISKFKSTLNN